MIIRKLPVIPGTVQLPAIAGNCLAKRGAFRSFSKTHI